MVNRILTLAALVCSPLCLGVIALAVPKIAYILLGLFFFGIIPGLLALASIGLIVGGALQLVLGFNNTTAQLITS